MTHPMPNTPGLPDEDLQAGHLTPTLAMSPRPKVTVTHPADDPRRQLAEGYRAVLGTDSWEAIHALAPSIPAADPTTLAPAERARLTRLLDAVRDELGLPGIVPVAPDRPLPRVETTLDPLLALGLLVRRSGPVWIADRPPAFEGLLPGSEVTLLLDKARLATILRRTKDPGWRQTILAHVMDTEDPA